MPGELCISAPPLSLAADSSLQEQQRGSLNCQWPEQLVLNLFCMCVSGDACRPHQEPVLLHADRTAASELVTTTPTTSRFSLPDRYAIGCCTKGAPPCASCQTQVNTYLEGQQHRDCTSAKMWITNYRISHMTSHSPLPRRSSFCQCWFVCKQDNSKSPELILIGGNVAQGRNPLNFTIDQNPGLDAGMKTFFLK